MTQDGENVDKERKAVITLIKGWIRKHVEWVIPFGLYDDRSGILCLRRNSCSCCSTAMTDDIKIDGEMMELAVMSLSDKEQQDIAYEFVDALIKHYELEEWIHDDYGQKAIQWVIDNKVVRPLE